MPFCSKCGAYVADSLDRCPSCGKKVRPDSGGDAWDVYKDSGCEDNGRRAGGKARREESSGEYRGTGAGRREFTGQTSGASGQASGASGQYRSAYEYEDKRAPRSGWARAGRTVYDSPGVTADQRLFSVCCYLSVLVVIPLLLRRNDPYVRFHVNQGLALFLLSLIRWAVGFMFILGIMAPILTIVIWVLSIKGIINALAGRCRPLPLIGKIDILK